MKPPVPTYIAEDMFRPSANYTWLIVLIIAVVLIYLWYKTTTDGKNTVQP